MNCSSGPNCTAGAFGSGTSFAETSPLAGEIAATSLGLISCGALRHATRTSSAHRAIFMASTLFDQRTSVRVPLLRVVFRALQMERHIRLGSDDPPVVRNARDLEDTTGSQLGLESPAKQRAA